MARKAKAYGNGPSSAKDWLKKNEARLGQCANRQEDGRSYRFPDNSLIVYHHEHAGTWISATGIPAASSSI